MNCVIGRLKNLSLTRWLTRVCLVALLAGCGRDEIKVYRVPKQRAEAPAAPHTHATAGSAAPRLSWTLPVGWEEQPASSMRAASFRVQGKEGVADVAVIPLPGVQGRDLEMVNLWREQMRLPRIGEEDMTRETEPVRIGAAEGKLFDLASTEPFLEGGKRARILAAMADRDATTWFFKMTGEDSLLAEQKAAFVKFLNSVEFHDSPHPTFAEIHEGISTNVKEVPHEATKPVWTVPEGWQEQPSASIRIGSFLITDEQGGKADVSVTQLGGAAGGLLPNVNRWRSQIKLPHVSEAELRRLITPLDVQGAQATLVDMSGADPESDQKLRLVAVVVPQADQTWFYKMLGDEKVVARQKDNLIKFVQSVKYPDAS